MELSDYSKIHQIYHREVYRMKGHQVVVQEKIDGCAVAGTKILTADLEYVDVETLKPGHKLLGCTEDLNSGSLVETKVVHNLPHYKHCVRVQMNDRHVTVTEDHPFCVHKKARLNGATKQPKTWVKAKDLRKGDTIVSLPLWQNRVNERDWGYVAGIFDGDGTLVNLTNAHNTRTLSFYNTNKVLCNEYKRILRRYGFTTREDTRQRKTTYKPMTAVILAGGWPEILRFYGTFQPLKIKSKIKKTWKGSKFNYIPRSVVRSVTDVGKIRVYGLETTSHTYTVEGMLCHNSQLSFGRKDGELFVRSKNKMVNLDAPDNMFGPAVAVLKDRSLPDGYVFRGEYLNKPKHNVLAYDRIPQDHIIIYDIEDGDGSNHYLPPDVVEEVAADLAFEVVPTLGYCDFEDISEGSIGIWMQRQSILGGQLIEGLVIKCYDLFDSRDKTLMCKYVRPEFKEMHTGKSGKNRKNIIEEIGDKLSTPARFEKAVQHARDEGLLVDEPKDIGVLMRELNEDFEEHIDEIKNLLYANYRKAILRVANRGFADWYKARLISESVNLTTPCIKCRREIKEHENTDGLCFPCTVARETLDKIEPIESGRLFLKENEDG